MATPEVKRLADRLLHTPFLPAEELARSVSWELGRYQVLGSLGAGACGEVHLAHDPMIGRAVAIKVLSEDMPRERFEREMQLMGSLDHPGIVRVYDAGMHGGRPFLVMEYVAGGTLEGARLPLREGVAALEQVARACHVAHERGIVHRDLKPANVLMGAQPKVADFGIAKVLDDPSGKLTRSGTVLGTPVYMAPEQLSDGQLGPWTDIHALGAMLYEMLTGRTPYHAEHMQEVLCRILKGGVRPAVEANPAAPRELSDVAARALDPEPARRHASAAAFADDLARWLGRSERPARAHPAGRLAGAVASAALLLALAAGLALSGGGPEARRPVASPAPATTASVATTLVASVGSSAPGPDAGALDPAAALVALDGLYRRGRLGELVARADALVAAIDALPPEARRAAARRRAVFFGERARFTSRPASERGYNVRHREAMLELIAGDSHDAIGLGAAAAVELHVGRPDGALELGRQALARDPELFPVRVLVALALGILGRSEALPLIEELRTEAPECPAVYEALGRALRSGGTPGPAADAFARCLELTEPGPNLTALKWRGVCRMEAGDLAGAGEDLARAVQIAPQDFDVRIFEGWLAWYRGDAARARAAWAQVARGNPSALRFRAKDAADARLREAMLECARGAGRGSGAPEDGE